MIITLSVNNDGIANDTGNNNDNDNGNDQR